MTTIYDNDECDRPPRRSFDDEPCHWCDDGSLPVGAMPNTVGCVPACGSCIMAFEEADAPEELAITLGDMCIDDIDTDDLEDQFRYHFPRHYDTD